MHGHYRSAEADGGETNPALPRWLLSAIWATLSCLLRSVPGCCTILTVLFLQTLGDAEVLLAPLNPRGIELLYSWRRHGVSFRCSKVLWSPCLRGDEFSSGCIHFSA